jgi:hypothetical protein
MNQADQDKLELFLSKTSKMTLETLKKGLLLAESLPEKKGTKKPTKKSGNKAKAKKSEGRGYTPAKR